MNDRPKAPHLTKQLTNGHPWAGIIDILEPSCLVLRDFVQHHKGVGETFDGQSSEFQA